MSKRHIFPHLPDPDEARLRQVFTEPRRFGVSLTGLGFLGAAMLMVVFVGVAASAARVIY